MKTVEMTSNYDYRVGTRHDISYEAGRTYEKVPNAHAEAIVAAGAGNVTDDHGDDDAPAAPQKAKRGRGR